MSSVQNIQYFKAKPKLLAILQSGGAMGQVFTVDQIVNYLGKYIENKQLYDEVNKRIIKCENDLLGELFNVKEFMIIDFKNLWNYLLPCLYLATPAEVSSSKLLPEKEGESSKKELELPWWYYVKRDKSDETNQSQKSEKDSYADRETILVQDTEYEDSEPEDTDYTLGENYVEYEPPESESDVESDDTTVPATSDEDLSILELQGLQSDTNSSGDETVATDCSVDTEIGLEEHWICPECRTTNSPTIGYCQRCWKPRKGWTHGIDMTRSLTDPVTTSRSEVPFCRGLSLDVSDSAAVNRNLLGSNLPSQSSINSTIPSFSSLKRKLDEETTDADNNSECKKIVLRNLEESASAESCSVASNSTTDSSDFHALCYICQNNPRNTLLVHSNQSGHRYTCFPCAKRLKKRGKSCPVCRRPIIMVAQIYD